MSDYGIGWEYVGKKSILGLLPSAMTGWLVRKSMALGCGITNAQMSDGSRLF